MKTVEICLKLCQINRVEIRISWNILFEICWNVFVFQLISTYFSPKIRWNLIKYVEICINFLKSLSEICWNMLKYIKLPCWNHLKTIQMIWTYFNIIHSSFNQFSVNLTHFQPFHRFKFQPISTWFQPISSFFNVYFNTIQQYFNTFQPKISTCFNMFQPAFQQI